METLRLGQGCCRDFAMLMIEAARSLGLAARFVSGYLAVPMAGSEEAPTGSTHAWAQVYLQAPVGSISIRQTAPSARMISLPLRSFAIRVMRFLSMAPSSGSRRTISAWRSR
jgi:hypothetical protein